jgi:hypothetical protein
MENIDSISKGKDYTIFKWRKNLSGNKVRVYNTHSIYEMCKYLETDAVDCEIVYCSYGGGKKLNIQLNIGCSNDRLITISPKTLKQYQIKDKILYNMNSNKMTLL